MEEMWNRGWGGTVSLGTVRWMPWMVQGCKDSYRCTLMSPLNDVQHFLNVFSPSYTTS
ncbi:hypothetical protein BC832DRAFT_548598 [Gaertneriomyces semiglobifer]|nr:hypothetical protein BC832DRAFT_548598 [Gaertneriomyces semiglobifer]